MIRILAGIAATVALSAHATTFPPHFIIGYPTEGAVDASTASCTQFVEEVTGWEGELKDQGIVKVCTARRSHAAALEQLQLDYDYFTRTIGQDVRLQPLEALDGARHVILDCIAYKERLTTGGHNIMIDIIPNDIYASCLRLGSELLNEQSSRYRDAGRAK